MAAISCFVIFAGGAGLTLREPQTVRGGIGDGIWWAIVTASTVGYGDIAPSTPWGRLIAIALMLAGVGLVSTLAASITSYFLGQEESAAVKELNERLDRIETLLWRLQDERPLISEDRNTNAAAQSDAAGTRPPRDGDQLTKVVTTTG